jgi:two-component sensor histidine kinase
MPMTAALNTIRAALPPPPPLVPAAPTLTAEADHRICNNLALIAGLLRMQAKDLAGRGGPLTMDAVRTALDETAARIEAVGQLHRMLVSADRGTRIDVSAYVHSIVNTVVTSVAGAGKATVSFDLPCRCLLNASQAMPLGLIVGEVVSNAIKYAHPAGVPTALSVSCCQTPSGLSLIIEDDGVGLPPGFDPMTSGGLGFRLIRTLSEQIGATCAFESLPAGLRFQLLLPYNPAGTA